MAQDQKTQKQNPDEYAQRGKTLASSARRLRGWVGSDPSRTAELADVLVELTAHRLQGHSYAAAASDAQDAVRLAAQLLTANGPIGPYTAAADAIRYITSVVHLATIQVGAGLPEAAGRTIESLQDMRQSLSGLRLDDQLTPLTAIWALSGTARAALAAGEPAKANAYADAALARLAESGLRNDPDSAYLGIDVDRLASDCRWAAGRTDEALTFLHGAKDRYEQVVAGRLDEPARYSPALVERLVEPLFGMYRDLADRLTATGEADLGLVTRRALVELLQGLTARLGDPARVQLRSALADLARDLLAADRVEEAVSAADEAAAIRVDRTSAGSAPLLVAAVHAEALTRAGRAAEAVASLRRVLPAEAGAPPSAVHAVGLLALADALRAEGEQEAAVSAERTLSELTRALLPPSMEGDATRTALLDLARGVVSRGSEPLSWSPLAPAASYAAESTAGIAPTGDSESQRETVAWLEAERAEAHRMELDRLEHARIEAERREAERIEAERIAAEQLAVERARAEQAERLEAGRRAAAEERERLERKRRREERIEAHRLEVERREAERRAERLAIDPDETERLELERLQAELAALEAPAEGAAIESANAEELAAERDALEREDAERREAERIEVAQAEAQRAEAERIEAERAEAQRIEAERAEAQRAEAQRVEAERAEAQRIEAERAEAQRAEAEQAEAQRIEAEQAEAQRAEAQRIEAEAQRIEAERAEAQRIEAERAEAQRIEAQRAEAQRAEAQRIEAQRAEAEQAEAQRAEAQRAEAQQAEAQRVEAEREAAVRAERREAEQPDELASAQRLWRDLRAQGDRRGARAANERVVELLRPRAAADLAAYGPQLQSALEELSSARLRSGDVWGSRAPAKEAKALAKTLGQ